MDRRRRARERARWLRLTGSPGPFHRFAFAAGCLGALLPGCSSGRLDTFEVVRQNGGRGAEAGGAAGAGGAGTGGGSGVGGAGADAGAAGLGGAGVGGVGAGGAGDAGTASDAGTAGSTSSGGSAGQTGPLLVDDFEDQNSNAPSDGWWYPIDDRTGPPSQMTFDPVTDRGDSRFGVHLAAGPTSGFGSFLGLDLPGPLFDATSFSSLSFWARMEPPGELSVRFQNAQVTQFQQVLELDATWQEVRLPLEDFVPVVEGGAPINLTELTHLQLWLPDRRPAFDLYIDDMWLLREP